MFSLAPRTKAKEFEPMGDGFEPIAGGDPFLEGFGKAFFDFNDLGAFGANQMMVMAIVPFGQEFEARAAFAEMAALHHLHFFQQMHRAIDSRQIAIPLR